MLADSANATAFRARSLHGVAVIPDEIVKRALSAGLAVVAVAACRGLDGAPADRVAPAAVSSPSGSTAMSGSPPAQTSVSSPTLKPAPEGPRCHTPQLSLRFAGAQNSAGTMFLAFQLANRGSGACLLHGFVGLQMLDAAGGAMITRVVRNGGVFANQPPPSAFLLAPAAGSGLAAAATFQVAYSAVRSRGETVCPGAFQLLVTPPEEAAPLTVPVQGWDLAPCNRGELYVSPLRPPGVATQ